MWAWLKELFEKWFAKKITPKPEPVKPVCLCDCKDLTPTNDRSLAPANWKNTEINNDHGMQIRCIGNKGPSDYTLTKIAFDNGLLAPTDKDGMLALNEKCGTVNGVRFHYEGFRYPSSESELNRTRPALVKKSGAVRPQWRTVKG